MKSVAIIGGGVAGPEAAGRLSELGYSVTIVEKTDRIGGRLNQWFALFPGRLHSDVVLGKLKSSIKNGVNIILNSTLQGIERNDDGFALILNNKKVITANAILLTTGFEIFDATRKEEYGYGIYENVITSVDLEKMFREGKGILTAQGRTPSRIGFIHCVGSRDEKAGNPHCSKVCCITAVKQAIEVKELIPSASVYLFYMDLRMFGRHFEELYKEAQFKYGIQFIRARLSEAFENPDGTLQIRIEDTLLGKPMKMQMDMIVLMVGIQQDRSKGNILEIAGIENDTDNFIMQHDPYFNPGSTGVEGVFCAGGITGPKTMEETLVEARAASAEIDRYLGHEGLLKNEPLNTLRSYDRIRV